MAHEFWSPIKPVWCSRGGGGVGESAGTKDYLGSALSLFRWEPEAKGQWTNSGPPAFCWLLRSHPPSVQLKAAWPLLCTRKHCAPLRYTVYAQPWLHLPASSAFLGYFLGPLGLKGLLEPHSRYSEWH